MSEPTMKDVAEWLRKVYDKEYNVWFPLLGHDSAHKRAQIWHDRASQVEAMGESRCGNCSGYKEFIQITNGTTKPMDTCNYGYAYMQGPDFCCIHWKIKEG